MNCLSRKCVFIKCLAFKCLAFKLSLKCVFIKCLSIKCLSIKCVFTKCLPFKCLSTKCLSPKSHWAFSWRKFKVCGWMLRTVKYGEKTNSSQNKSLRCIYTGEVRCAKLLPTAITAVLALAFLGEMETMKRQVLKMSIDYRGHHWNVVTQPKQGRQAGSQGARQAGSQAGIQAGRGNEQSISNQAGGEWWWAPHF
jgi:hypothetical protein